ncbi:Pentatricopeptide repeat-containing protein [Capsicum baccatum]|uniref:Pentatricopeptide repeat-containing protein n=1 Tax=Capsicum baccatum TaxID=33114 RepID=A0A2G2VX46_CAPBA|nr:Pentatricopeptide repeat-containing protein [Capsicum baccatum]
MPSRNVISLTAMICGCSQNGKYADALAVYKEMEKAGGVNPNEVKIASVLLACANLGALEVGEKIEVYARESGYFKNMFICNFVLEMYTKCVRIDRAMQLFLEIGRRRNLCSWNTMIMGLAVYGKSDKALKLSNQMLGEGNAPDDVTFVGAILA